MGINFYRRNLKEYDLSVIFIGSAIKNDEKDIFALNTRRKIIRSIYGENKNLLIGTNINLNSPYLGNTQQDIAFLSCTMSLTRYLPTHVYTGNKYTIQLERAKPEFRKLKGIYKKYGNDYSHFLQTNRKIEDKVRELNGRKVLYAHAYYSQDEFWKIYDYSWYNLLRDKYFANRVSPDVYEKVKVTEKYKPSIIVGLWNTMRSEKIPIS